MEKLEKKDLQRKKPTKRQQPVIVSKEISDWLRSQDRNTHVNNYKKAGGYKPSGK